MGSMRDKNPLTLMYLGVEDVAGHAEQLKTEKRSD